MCFVCLLYTSVLISEKEQLLKFIMKISFLITDEKIEKILTKSTEKINLEWSCITDGWIKQTALKNITLEPNSKEEEKRTTEKPNTSCEK